jgi:hypothetical protein
MAGLPRRRSADSPRPGARATDANRRKTRRCQSVAWPTTSHRDRSQGRLPLSWSPCATGDADHGCEQHVQVYRLRQPCSGSQILDRAAEVGFPGQEQQGHGLKACITAAVRHERSARGQNRVEDHNIKPGMSHVDQRTGRIYCGVHLEPSSSQVRGNPEPIHDIAVNQ